MSIYIVGIYAICFMLADLSNGLLSASQWAAARRAVNHQKANLNSKLSTLGKLHKENSERGRERGGSNSNALRRTAWFVVVLFSNALEEVYFGAMLEFAAFCGTAHHPHGRRPLERAYLLLAGHLAPLGNNSEASLVMALKCLDALSNGHTLYKAGKHLVVASMPRLYITA